jgi:hypothetical protein
VTGGAVHIRHGFGAARPYLYGNLDLADFVRDAFGGAGIERHQMAPKSFHVETWWIATYRPAHQRGL